MSAYRWAEGPCSEGAWLVVHRWPGHPRTRKVLVEHVETGERVTRPWHPSPRRVPGAEPEFMATVRKARQAKADERRGIRPDGTDPLEGMRSDLNAGRLKRLVWPADVECPVEVGDTFGLRSGQVTITRVVKKPRLVNRPAQWEAEFSREVPDRPRLLRRTPPANAPERDELDQYGQVPPPDAAAEERGRLEGSYTTSPLLAVPGDAGEGVPDDWEDRDKEKREKMRAEAARETRKAEDTAEQVRKLKARLTMVPAAELQTGRDAAPLLGEIADALARWEAEKVELREAA